MFTVSSAQQLWTVIGWVSLSRECCKTGAVCRTSHWIEAWLLFSQLSVEEILYDPKCFLFRFRRIHPFSDRDYRWVYPWKGIMRPVLIMRSGRNRWSLNRWTWNPINELKTYLLKQTKRFAHFRGTKLPSFFKRATNMFILAPGG